jgi:hypothetical protein
MTRISGCIDLIPVGCHIKTDAGHNKCGKRSLTTQPDTSSVKRILKIVPIPFMSCRQEPMVMVDLPPKYVVAMATTGPPSGADKAYRWHLPGREVDDEETPWLCVVLQE